MLIENEGQGTWREAYLSWKGAILSESQVQLLTEGPKSLAQANQLQAMKLDYEKNSYNNRL